MVLPISAHSLLPRLGSDLALSSLAREIGRYGTLALASNHKRDQGNKMKLHVCNLFIQAS